MKSIHKIFHLQDVVYLSTRNILFYMQPFKNPLTLENGDFEKYATHKHSCLEKKDDKFALKRTHDYYYQVQQQLFTLPE